MGAGAISPAPDALFLLIRLRAATRPRDAASGMGPLRQSGQKTVGDNRRPAYNKKKD